MTSLNNLLKNIQDYLAPLQQTDEDVCIRSESRLLINFCLNLDSLDWIRNPDRPVSKTEQELCFETAKRRLGHEPLSRIKGFREFWSMNFSVTPETLDPRADSECLVERVLEWCDTQPEGRNGEYRLLDLGTGSGCLLISLLSELPNAIGVGVDIQQGAVETALRNATSYQMKDRFFGICTEWTTAIKGKFDIILTNPPYIETSTLDTLAPEVQIYDPVQALDGGTDGLDAYRQIIPALPDLLKKQGFVICEIGITQEHAVENLLREASFTQVGFHRDLSSRIRCVFAFFTLDK